MTPLQTALLLHFAPPWARRVALSPNLAAQTIARPILSDGSSGHSELLILPHLPEGTAGGRDTRDHMQIRLEARDLNSSAAHSLDLIYLAARHAPQSTREAVAVFAKLDGGGRVIMEIADGQGARRALRSIAQGNGLELVYAGRPRTRGVIAELPGQLSMRGDASREAAIAVLAKPPLPATHLSRESGDRPRLTIALTISAGQLGTTANAKRLQNWRDWLLTSGLHKTTELLLIGDGPLASGELNEFASAHLRDLRRSQALRLIAHYRRFGVERGAQTAASLARGRLFYAEELPDTHALQMPCRELPALIQALWNAEGRVTTSGHTILIRPRGLLVRQQGRERVVKNLGRNFPAALLLNAAGLAALRDGRVQLRGGGSQRGLKFYSENVCVQPDGGPTSAVPRLPDAAR